MNYDDIALHVPEILLPAPDIDLSKWCVIACDQYTSQPEYWEKVAALAGGAPSTLHLVYPEAYLETRDEQASIAAINSRMTAYCAENVLVPQKPGFVLVDRKTAHVPSRKGLVVGLDLERYDYTRGSQSLIRATEDTIIERLHSRIRIRQKAPIELPHIMVLIDDPDKTVIEPLFEHSLSRLYDTDLMMHGGHVTGYAVQDPVLIGQVADNLQRLADPARFKHVYGATDQQVLLYAMGDGNHSFATAKAIWETIKQKASDKKAIMAHPARYALVELVNLHDDGLLFEPIHRVLFNVDSSELLKEMVSFFKARGAGQINIIEDNPARIHSLLASPGTDGAFQTIAFVTATVCGRITIDDPAAHLAVKGLQGFLDTYLQQNAASKIDYIHGMESLYALASQPDAVGFFLPPIAKNSLFKTVIFEGALPRKAFSMGSPFFSLISVKSVHFLSGDLERRVGETPVLYGQAG